jgi:hypothetical protein
VAKKNSRQPIAKSMNPTQPVPVDRTVSREQTTTGLRSFFSALSFDFGRRAGLALCLLGAATLFLSQTAFGDDSTDAATKVATTNETGSPSDPTLSKEEGRAAVTGGANPHEENLLSKAMRKFSASGGSNPRRDAMASIQHSLQEFGHLEYMLRLFLSLVLSVGCAWVIAWRPRRSMSADPLGDLEERKTFIILGVVGAIVAELSGASQTLAFVIFGIGALLRFRTLLDNPKATGKAILVVVIGLACGMGSWTMAVFVTAFSWLLLYWLDSKVSCRIRIRLEGDADPKSVYGTMQSLLVSHHCQIQSHTLSKGKRRMEFVFHMPAALDLQKLEADVKSKFPKLDESRINVQMV